MSELVASMTLCEEQLAKVEEALRADSQNAELLQLRTDLRELARLTKQTLLATEIPPCVDPPPPTTSSTTQTPSTSAESDVDVAAIEGTKCKAPHNSSSGHTTYHNGIIFHVESSLTAAQTLEDILVRVVFSHPTETGMVPCPFYLDGRCRFPDDMCKYSHGEIVSLASLQEYEEPDFKKVIVNERVLGKDPEDGLWHHAKVEGFESQNTFVLVRFDRNNKDVQRIPIEDTLPLRGEKQKEKVFEVLNDPVDRLEMEDAPFVPQDLLDRIAPGALGEWEQFTRGIGSKIMAKMGYITGTGLGNMAQGRVEPVPVMLYPTGKSLDWCMEMREKNGGDLEKKRTKTKAEKKACPIEKKNVFDFINSKLGGKRGSLGDLQKNQSTLKKSNLVRDATHVKGASESHLRIQNLKLHEDIQRTEKEIERLKKSYARHRGTDEATALGIRSKLAEKENLLKRLRASESTVSREVDMRKDHRKLSIF